MRRADIEVPNFAVDMDSWAKSACYPRGTFYPLSYDPSTRDRRITRALFRDCSTRRSRSKSGLCSYTRNTVSIRAEPNFALLRYLFGGDRPSQTARHPRSPARMTGIGVRPQTYTGWYFTLWLSPSRNKGFKASHLCYAAYARGQ